MGSWEAEGEAKAVIVIIHGAMEHHQRYDWLIQKWCSAGFHVVMSDLPGQGMTKPQRRGHIDSFNDYLLEVKNWIFSAYQYELPVFLLGHSMGGLIVIRLLQEERLNIAGVILSSPCLGLVTYPNKALNTLSLCLNVMFPALRMNSGITVDMATRNEDVRLANKYDQLYITKVSIRWYRELIKSMELALINVDKTQNVPMLLMQASDDKIVDKIVVRDWYSKLPLSEKRFKEWANCYHEIYNEPERQEIFEYGKDFVLSQLKSTVYFD